MGYQQASGIKLIIAINLATVDSFSLLADLIVSRSNPRNATKFVR